MAITNIFQKRYIFYRGNLTTTPATNRLLSIIRRGAAVGWNGLVLEESGCMRAVNPNTTCFANLTIIKNECKKLGVALIPYSMSQGEPVKTSLTEIREGLPVRDSKFVVSGTTATCKGDPTPALVNGGFETRSGNTASGWILDKPGVISFVDTAVKHSGTASIRVQNPAGQGNIRIYQSFAATPFRGYRISVWLKTEGFTSPGSLKFLVLGGNGRYLYSNRDYPLGSPPPASTQNWTQYVIDVNSLESSSLRLYLVSTSNASGKVWWDDVTVTEVGLYSTIRRASLPVVVKSFDKSKTYIEGKDYVVGAEKLTIPSGSAITSGMSLKVSWFSLCDNYELWGIPASACSPEFFSTLKTNCNIINSRVQPLGWMMRYNEWRTANWDPACSALTAGPYLASTISKSEDILKSINPAIERYLWNDLFDPWHSAVDMYYGVNGSLKGSWKGISADTIIMNWYNNNSTNNMKFWAGLDPAYPKIHHRQILCGYYESVSNVATWLSLLTKAESEGVTGVDGFLYTTWSAGDDGAVGRYNDLEAVANLIKASGRWGNGPAFPVIPVPPVPLPTVEQTQNDDGSLVKYVGAWTNSDAAPSRIGNDEHYSNVAGSLVELSFTGTQVKWIATKFSNRGHAEVFLDGTFQAIVDLFSPTVLYQQVVYTKTGLASGSHVLKIVCKGTKNASSTGMFVDVDAFKYQ